MRISFSFFPASKAALSKAESVIASLKAGISEAESAVELQGARLSDTKIYSPAGAVVEYRSLEPGEVVSPGMSIMTLVDLSEMWVRIDLGEGDVAQVRPGQRAEVTLERLPGRVFAGEIFDIGRQARFATERDVTRGRQDIKTFRTRIRVTGTDGILKPGMTVIVTIPVQ